MSTLSDEQDQLTYQANLLIENNTTIDKLIVSPAFMKEIASVIVFKRIYKSKNGDGVYMSMNGIFTNKL